MTMLKKKNKSELEDLYEQIISCNDEATGFLLLIKYARECKAFAKELYDDKPVHIWKLSDQDLLSQKIELPLPELAPNSSLPVDSIFFPLIPALAKEFHETAAYCWNKLDFLEQLITNYTQLRQDKLSEGNHILVSILDGYAYELNLIVSRKKIQKKRDFIFDDYKRYLGKVHCDLFATSKAIKNSKMKTGSAKCKVIKENDGIKIQKQNTKVFFEASSNRGKVSHKLINGQLSFQDVYFLLTGTQERDLSGKENKSVYLVQKDINKELKAKLGIKTAVKSKTNKKTGKKYLFYNPAYF